jgi:NTE family protein
VLTISTRYDRTRAEADRPQVTGYPPPAQVLGVLYNAIFLDLIDQDVLRLERLNRLVGLIPPERRSGLRVIDMLVLRPSRDLGRLAGEYEPRLPRVFRFLTRGLGTRKTESPDILSLVMFQEDYLRRLIELGEEDAEHQWDQIAAFLERTERPENAIVGQSA